MFGSGASFHIVNPVSMKALFYGNNSLGISQQSRSHIVLSPTWNSSCPDRLLRKDSVLCLFLPHADISALSSMAR